MSFISHSLFKSLSTRAPLTTNAKHLSLGHELEHIRPNAPLVRPLIESTLMPTRIRTRVVESDSPSAATCPSQQQDPEMPGSSAACQALASRGVTGKHMPEEYSVFCPHQSFCRGFRVPMAYRYECLPRIHTREPFEISIGTLRSPTRRPACRSMGRVANGKIRSVVNYQPTGRSTRVGNYTYMLTGCSHITPVRVCSPMLGSSLYVTLTFECSTIAEVFNL